MPKKPYDPDKGEKQVIILRVPKKLKDQIIDDIQETGDFDTITAWMMAAAREFLKTRKEDQS